MYGGSVDIIVSVKFVNCLLVFILCGGQMTQTLTVVVGQAVTEGKVSVFSDGLTFTIMMICY
jgi:hypothetical protein